MKEFARDLDVIVLSLSGIGVALFLFVGFRKIRLRKKEEALLRKVNEKYKAPNIKANNK